MRGGAGDDTYVVDRTQDKVEESPGGGIDTVLSSSGSYVLPSEVENLRLVATFSQSATGNGLSNRMVSNDAGSTLNGGGGDDILIAGGGADVLTGGAGRDIFQFNKTPSKPAHVTDFTPGSDMLDLRGLFAGAGYVGADPTADGRLALKLAAGGVELWFDADGAGQTAAKLVVILDGLSTTALTAQNDWFFT